MPCFVYVSAHAAYCVDRWLRALSLGRIETASRDVHVLCPPADRAMADAICAAAAGVQRVWEIPEDAPAVEALSDQIRVAAGEVWLPASLDPLYLRRLPGLHLPDVRPLHAVLRRLWTLGFRTFNVYTLGGTARLSIPCMLDEFQGRHRGERCFVVGNGPSLNAIDMAPLEDEITFGANRCYLGYDRWGYQFTYWGIVDEFQIERYAGEYEAHVPAETVKFLPLEYLPLIQMEQVCPVHFSRGRRTQFFDTPEQLGMGHSVTYALVQLAAVMGCDPIILIGVDHRYDLNEAPLTAALRHVRERLVRPLRGTFAYHAVRTWRQRQGRTKPLLAPSGKNCWDGTDATGATHFDRQYARGAEKRFALPQLREARRDFQCAQRWAQEKGVQILNATPGSALDVFPMVDYDALL